MSQNKGDVAVIEGASKKDFRFDLSGKTDAETYHNLNKIQREGAKALIEWMGIFKGAVILDACCGTGWATNYMADIVGGDGMVIGFDGSRDNIEMARELYPRANLVFHHQTAENLDQIAHPNEFDFVTMFSAIHFLADPLAVLWKINRALKMGGKFGFTSGAGDAPRPHQDIKTRVLARPRYRNLPRSTRGDGTLLIWHQARDLFDRSGFLGEQFIMTPYSMETATAEVMFNFFNTSTVKNYTGHFPSSEQESLEGDIIREIQLNHTDPGKGISIPGTRLTCFATKIAELPDNDDAAVRLMVRSPGTSGRSYGPALSEFAAYADRERAAAGMPGLSFCIVGPDGLAAVGISGWADEGRTIMEPSHLHQIGSISKAFTALSVYWLADRGEIDMDAPLSDYLDDVPLPDQTITLQQLLSHTGGLPRSAPIFPQTPDGKLWTGFKPGTGFSYSNTGYDLAGAALEGATGKPFRRVLLDLVKALGITGLKEVIQASDRASYAVGHSPLDISGPSMSHVPLGQIPWSDYDTPAGNIGATPDAMISFIQSLIAIAQCREDALLSNEMAKRFISISEPAAKAAAPSLFGKDASYANGLAIIDLDGHPALHHIGGARGYCSSLTVELDPDLGVGYGCYVSMNGSFRGYRPSAITQFACRMIRALIAGQKTPRPPPTIQPDRIEGAEDYAGTYVGPDDDRFAIMAREDRLFLVADGQQGRMQYLGEGKILCDHPHPRFRSHFLDFMRNGGAVEQVWCGPVLYGRGAAAPQPKVPAELAALQGDYSSGNGYTGWWRSIYAQGSELMMENISVFRSKSKLTRHKSGYWVAEDPEASCERIWFDCMVKGIPRQLNVSGCIFLRFCKM